MSNLSDFVIDNGALLQYKGNDSNVIIPDSVTTIGRWAFAGCANLTSISIPDVVTTIGWKAFKGCANLASIDIPASVTTIGSCAFEDCANLTSINIPDSVTIIGSMAFEGCSNLTSITIPKSVTTIGWRVFSGCEKLNELIIGGNLENTRKNAFENFVPNVILAPNMAINVLKKLNILSAAILGFFKHRELFTDADIISGYEKLAISQRKKLLPLIFEEDLVCAIEFYAQGSKITVANFEEEYFAPAQKANASECIAFLLDWKNKNVTAEQAEKQIEKELNKDPFNSADMKKLWRYEKLKNGTLVITGYKGDEIDVIIPDHIGKNAVSAIGSEAFSAVKKGRTPKQAEKLRRIKSVTILGGITSIGNLVFEGCTNLTYITIPASVTKIGDWAFFRCNLTIHAPAGSCAKKYAKKNDIPFVAI